jgi:hypothetical protein
MSIGIALFTSKNLSQQCRDEINFRRERISSADLDRPSPAIIHELWERGSNEDYANLLKYAVKSRNLECSSFKKKMKEIVLATIVSLALEALIFVALYASILLGVLVLVVLIPPLISFLDRASASADLIKNYKIKISYYDALYKEFQAAKKVSQSKSCFHNFFCKKKYSRVETINYFTTKNLSQDCLYEINTCPSSFDKYDFSPPIPAPEILRELCDRGSNEDYAKLREFSLSQIKNNRSLIKNYTNRILLFKTVFLVKMIAMIYLIYLIPLIALPILTLVRFVHAIHEYFSKEPFSDFYSQETRACEKKVSYYTSLYNEFKDVKKVRCCSLL